MFLGALVVIITLLVLLAVWLEAPQIWFTALLCLLGVAALELGGDSGPGHVNGGDFWLVLKDVGVSVGFFFTKKMMATKSNQALLLTAVQVSMA